MENENLLKSLEELLSDLQWLDEEISQDLTKGPNYWKNKDPAKYKKMLAKLSVQRKTPGHKERGYQQVLQAKRREKGGSGTTSGQNGHKGHASGRMKTKTGSAVKRYASAEKKHGKKMSMNRKNNNKGYGSGNVELISQKYNQGDEKYSKKAPEKRLKGKLKKLKKALIGFENLNKAVVYKKIPKGSCTCGAHKINSEGHSDWCDGLQTSRPTSEHHVKHILNVLNDVESPPGQHIWAKSHLNGANLPDQEVDHIHGLGDGANASETEKHVRAMNPSQIKSFAKEIYDNVLVHQDDEDNAEHVKNLKSIINT